MYHTGDRTFLSLLQGRFSRSLDGCMRDIYDGKAYTPLTFPGEFLSVPTNITLLMNTDGAQVFHSSTRTMWPVFFVINELPPALRCTRVHTCIILLY